MSHELDSDLHFEYEQDARPWGGWEIIYRDPETVVKVLTIVPGGVLSLQTHSLREEWWRLTEGNLRATINGQTFRMLPFVTYRVQVGVIHRLVNDDDRVARVVEVIKGEYDENDIVRLHDIYERD